MEKLFVAVFCLQCVFALSSDCSIKYSDSPIVNIYVIPEINVKGSTSLINVTCSAESADAFSLPLQKMWMSPPNDTQMQLGVERNYCHKYVCNHTLYLTEASFGNDSSLIVTCQAYAQTHHCTLVTKTLQLLDTLPTTKPVTSQGTTTKPVPQALNVDAAPTDIPTTSIIAISTGTLALIICILIVACFVHRKNKGEEASNVVIDPIRPLCGFPSEHDFRKPSVYPVDIGDDNDSSQPEEVIPIDAGITLTIPMPRKILGSGNFGVVVFGKLQDYNDNEVKESDVAIKMLRDFDNPKRKIEFEKEIESLKDLDHPNVVKLLATYSNPTRIYIIMEYVSKGNLTNILQGEKVVLSVQLLYKFAYDIACGMEYVASKKKIHRDLAARNVLISEDNTAKISDFGLARSIEESGQYFTIQGYIPLKWVALEALETKCFSVETDIWSYGIVLWEIFSLGKEPYEFANDCHSIVTLKNFLRDGSRLTQPNQCSDETFSMMRRCWDINTSNRPSFTELKNWAKPLAGL